MIRPERMSNQSSRMVLRHCSSRKMILGTLFVSGSIPLALALPIVSSTDTDHDIEKLIERTEVEGDAEETPGQGAASFTFAKIWSAEKDTLEDVVEDADATDSWAQTLQKISTEREKVQSQEIARSGRGVRRKAAVIAEVAHFFSGAE